MFAGKTTMLISTVMSMQQASKEVLVLKYDRDNRYQREDSVNSELVTHSGLRLQAWPVRSLSEISDDIVKRNDVLAIDEGHFFPDLARTVNHWVSDLGKVVLVAGLDMNFMRTPWPEMLALRSPLYAPAHPIAVHQMTAICSQCGDPAYYSKRLDPNNRELIVIGGAKEYAPVCERHFN